MKPADIRVDYEGIIPVAGDNNEDMWRINDFVSSHKSYLEDLRKQVNDATAKDRVLIYEDIQTEILTGAGDSMWFNLAFKLVGYIKSRADDISNDNEHLRIFHQHMDCIRDRIDELKLSLEAENKIFKIAAGSLLYVVALMDLIEHRVRSNQSCCLPVRFIVWAKPPSDPVPHQMGEVLGELKRLQDNLMFATLTVVRENVAHSMVRRTPILQALNVGVNHHARHIFDHFQNSGVHLVGIYGQAGLGKTTLLNEVVGTLQNSHKHFFVACVEVGERPDDLRKLQSSLLQQLGGGRQEFATTSQGRSALLYHLQKLKYNNKQAYVAIDNIFDIRLIGELFPHSLGKVLPLRTSIIVTSPSLAIINRLDQLCRSASPHYYYLPYRLPALSAMQARTLFLSCFRSAPIARQSMVKDDVELVDQIVLHCEGNPLALKVTGSYFAQQDNLPSDNWGAIHRRMHIVNAIESPEDRMFSKLLVIYDRLDEGLREAFLDISIFFRGWDWRTVERILGQSQMTRLTSQGLIEMIEKDVDSLFSVRQCTRYSENPWKINVVSMHDLMATIGCRRAQGSRILSEDQAHLPERLVIDGPGNELSNVQGLFLLNCKEAIQGQMLEKMHGLRLLFLHDTGVRGHCTKVLHNLQIFYWGRSQPSSEVKIPFQMNRMKKLEVLILRAHDIDLNLKYPPHLKDLTLIGCNNMEDLPPSIMQLSGLIELHLQGCCRLQCLTEELGNLRILRRFRMENCNGMKQLPRALGTLTKLKEIDLSGSQNLTSIVAEIGNLVNLRKLDLSRCKNLTLLPPQIGGLRSLVQLYLGHCPLTFLCPEIGNLKMLEELSLASCDRLETLPMEIGNLVLLERLNLSSCGGLKELPTSIGCLESLMQLDLSGCTALSKLPKEVWSLTSLQRLDLDYRKHLAQLPRGIKNLVSLQDPTVNCCLTVSNLPAGVTGLPSLSAVNLVGCSSLSMDHSYGYRLQADDSHEVHVDHSELDGVRVCNR